MKSILINKRGMTIVELFIYAFVASLILGFFVFLFSRTSKVREQQTLEMDCQKAFTKLCQQVEKDLTGCKAFKIQKTQETEDIQEMQNENKNSSLIIDRIQEQIIYDANLENECVVRQTEKAHSKFSFKGRRKVILKTLSFSKDPQMNNGINLKIRLDGVPPIELSHNFVVHISDKDDAKGFFKTKDLGNIK